MRKDAWRDTQRHSTKLNERESLGQPLTTPKLNPTSLLQTSAFIYFILIYTYTAVATVSLVRYGKRG